MLVALVCGLARVPWWIFSPLVAVMIILQTALRCDRVASLSQCTPKTYAVTFAFSMAFALAVYLTALLARALWDRRKIKRAAESARTQSRRRE